MKLTNQSNLDGAIVYLAGPIQFAKDDGVNWRNELKSKLGDYLRVIDPCDKPEDKTLDVQEEKRHAKEMKKLGDYKALQDFVRKYRHLDLRYVDISDFIVALIDTDIHLCGTYDEIFNAERQRKPIIFIAANGKQRLPDWLFAFADLEYIVESVDECVDLIEKINSGVKPLNKKWVLARKYLNA